MISKILIGEILYWQKKIDLIYQISRLSNFFNKREKKKYIMIHSKILIGEMLYWEKIIDWKNDFFISSFLAIIKKNIWVSQTTMNSSILWQKRRKKVYHDGSEDIDRRNIVLTKKIDLIYQIFRLSNFFNKREKKKQS